MLAAVCSAARRRPLVFKMFLPVSKKDMKEREIASLDFIYIIGDAYVDHSSFGHAIISRVLESLGFTVG